MYQTVSGCGHQLINHMIRCIEWVEKGVESVTSLEKMKSVLSSLSQRLSTTDLEDFELVCDVCPLTII